ncbi:MAG: hypothetical protein RJA57_616 [Bacteroidota bacterium]|jgi:aspartate kinase
MKVFKFGGASVNSVERIRNIPNILRRYPGERILIVLSAMGKTTNALEKVAAAFFTENREEAIRLIVQIREEHLTTARALLSAAYTSCAERLRDHFTEVEWLLYDRPVRESDYYYDQIVSIGELLSTTIVGAYLEENGWPVTWLDVRDIIRTDDNFRNARVDWEQTRKQTDQRVRSIFGKTPLVLTQGFIGATDENESTTLGREGSDYSAAIFAHLLDAEDLTIWKDVDAVMNADPKRFPDVVSIPALNYTEVIEMAYYGAQIIHPKTIKPLQNKRIPLYVKSFIDPAKPGTVIDNRPLPKLPPMIIVKEDQVRLELRARDFSFIGEHHVGQLYTLLERLQIRPNLTQNAAIDFLCVLDEWEEKIEKLALAASQTLDVQVTRGLTLFTIRHYNQAITERLIGGREVLLRQQTPDTIQVLVR